jgi:hypothetical protein
MKLYLILFPFVSAAMSINIFLLALLGTYWGFAALSPVASLSVGAIAGIPATWFAVRWVERLIREAEE